MKIIRPSQVSSKGGHYAPGILSNGMLYVSGQLAIDPATGELAEGGIKEHTLTSLKNVERIVNAAGATKNDIVQCRVYVPDVALWNDVDEVYRNFFGEHTPARIVVPCNTLHHGSLIEIEAVAEIEK